MLKNVNFHYNLLRGVTTLRITDKCGKVRDTMNKGRHMKKKDVRDTLKNIGDKG